MLFRRKNPVGKFTVVCNQYKAGRILIKPPGGEQSIPTQRGGHQIDHGFLFCIPARGHDACGFIEHEIKIFGNKKRPAGNSDLIRFWIGFLPGIPHGAAIEGNSAAFDEPAHIAARKRALGGDQFINAFLRHGAAPFFFEYQLLPLCSGRFQQCACGSLSKGNSAQAEQNAEQDVESP